MKRNYKIIAVDFDGTLCTNKFPEIGDSNESLIEYCKTVQRGGNKLILWTCRNGRPLVEAVEWCAAHDLIFDGINENLREIVDMMGGDTRKVFADIYIDDKAIDSNYFYEVTEFLKERMKVKDTKREKRFELIVDICREVLNEYGNIEDTLDEYNIEHGMKDMLENSWLVDDLLNL